MRKKGKVGLRIEHPVHTAHDQRYLSYYSQTRFYLLPNLGYVMLFFAYSLA
jgi:hypothetical protein